MSGETSNRKPAERLRLDRIEFEAYFNNFSPFTLCIALYITAFVLAVLAWLGWPEGVQSLRQLVALVHVRTPYVWADLPDLHFGPAADHEPLFVGGLHRLGGGLLRASR